LVGAGGSRRYAEAPEDVQHGSIGHAEVFADRCERLAVLVHRASDRDIFVGQDAITTLDACSPQEAEYGGAVYAELSSEGGGCFADEIAFQQV
jgi:hypothetical protein